MAFRIRSKIIRSIVQIKKKFYSNKSGAEKSLIKLDVERDLAKPNNEAIKDDVNYHEPPVVGCRKKYTADMELKKLQMRALQPSLLPKYYKSPIDLQTGTYPKPPETSRQEYRHFEKSLTYQNVKLPLKKPRLASPFPDPVKVMPSDVTSDQEKAEHMQATARMPSIFTPPTISSGYSQYRYYSKQTLQKECQKDEIEANECPQVKITGIAPKKEIICDNPYIFDKFKKRDAPYPSFSELCHNIEDIPHTEYKTCPWKPRTHPTFKKNKYYATSMTKNHKFGRRNLKRSRKTRILNEKHNILLEGIVDSVLNYDNSMALEDDPRLQKPCTRRNDKICPQEKKDKSDEKGKPNRSQSGNKKPTKKAASFMYNDSLLKLIANSKLSRLVPDRTSIINYEENKNWQDSKNLKKGKCKKFSFKLPTKKEIEEIKKCPKHEKERLVECPRDRCEDNGPPWDDRLFFIKCDNKTKNNCPKDEKEKCQKIKNEDPCELDKENTRECPKDLLEKKNRKPPVPVKKTNALYNPFFNSVSVSDQPHI